TKEELTQYCCCCSVYSIKTLTLSSEESFLSFLCSVCFDLLLLLEEDDDDDFDVDVEDFLLEAVLLDVDVDFFDCTIDTVSDCIGACIYYLSSCLHVKH